MQTTHKPSALSNRGPTTSSHSDVHNLFQRVREAKRRSRSPSDNRNGPRVCIYFNKTPRHRRYDCSDVGGDLGRSPPLTIGSCPLECANFLIQRFGLHRNVTKDLVGDTSGLRGSQVRICSHLCTGVFVTPSNRGLRPTTSASPLGVHFFGASANFRRTLFTHTKYNPQSQSAAKGHYQY